MASAVKVKSGFKLAGVNLDRRLRDEESYQQQAPCGGRPRSWVSRSFLQIPRIAMQDYPPYLAYGLINGFEVGE
jgi:hypothetical protein